MSKEELMDKLARETDALRLKIEEIVARRNAKHELVLVTRLGPGKPARTTFFAQLQSQNGQVMFQKYLLYQETIEKMVSLLYLGIAQLLLEKNKTFLEVYEKEIGQLESTISRLKQKMGPPPNLGNMTYSEVKQWKNEIYGISGEIADVARIVQETQTKVRNLGIAELEAAIEQTTLALAAFCNDVS